MREVVSDVYLLEGLRGANAYLLASEQELTLIDTGVSGDVDRTAAIPSHSRVTFILNWIGQRIMFRLSPCKVDRYLEARDVIDALGGLQVIHTPGHTPGSMCLYQQERKILFCGDVLFNAYPITGKPGLQLPLSLVSVDNAGAYASAVKLSALDVQVLCPGHGEPIPLGVTGRIKDIV